jgi:hypothetical protein
MIRRPVIDPAIFKLAAGLTPIQDHLRELTSGLAPVQAQFAQIAAGLAPVVAAQHEQIAKILQASGSFFKGLFPDNWDDIDGLDIDAAEKIMLDEGIPLVAVPRGATVQLLVSASGPGARRAILGRRWKSITSDCETCLGGLLRPDIAGLVGYAGKVVAALRGGHTEAAQALAANLLDSLLLAHFGDDLKEIKKAHKKRQSLDLDDYTVRVAFTIAPAWSAYQTFWPSNGDRVPRTFARHASAHAVASRQYSRVNTVIALMLVTSLLWLLDQEATARAA